MRVNALKLLTIFIIVSPLICSAGSGCIREEALEATFDQLFSDPEIYNNRNITIEGFYLYDFEHEVLSERLEYPKYKEDLFPLMEREIWVSGKMPKEVYDALCVHSFVWRYGKVRMTGKFEYGESYGHLGGWSMQITPTKTVILPWTPPALE